MARGIYEERAARRIAHEREARGLSLQGLSDVMATFGVPIDKSSIQRIEKGDRRVNVDELVAFAAVFRFPLESLVQDDDVVDARSVRDTYRKWQEAVAARERAIAAERGLRTILQRKVAKNAATEATLEELVREDAARAFANQLEGADSADEELAHGDEWLRKVLDGARDLRRAWEAESEARDV